MNTSLTISYPAVSERKPFRSSILILFEAYFKLLFTPTVDDFAALRYAASKYNGEID